MFQRGLWQEGVEPRWSTRETRRPRPELASARSPPVFPGTQSSQSRVDGRYGPGGGKVQSTSPAPPRSTHPDGRAVCDSRDRRAPSRHLGGGSWHQTWAPAGVGIRTSKGLGGFLAHHGCKRSLESHRTVVVLLKMSPHVFRWRSHGVSKGRTGSQLTTPTTHIEETGSC